MIAMLELLVIIGIPFYNCEIIRSDKIYFAQTFQSRELILLN